MNAKDILIGLGDVDEQFILEAEYKSLKPKKVMKYAMPITASIVILLLLLYHNGGNILPKKHNLNPLSPTESDRLDNLATKYKLHFNNASVASASKRAIQGHFWQSLDAQQLTKLLPLISKKYEVDGTVHYSSVDEKATLYEVSTSVMIQDTLYGNITISPNKIIKDFITNGEPVLSDIEGVKVEAGLVTIDKNSHDEQNNYMYYADFEMDNHFYYLEFVSENGKVEDIFTNIVADVILGGKADLSVFDN